MSTTAAFDEDLEAIIRAADETPEYKDELIESFIAHRTKRKKRRLNKWSSAALLLILTVGCSVLIDKVVSFPLSAVALILIWVGVISFYAVRSVLWAIESSLVRIVLRSVLSRRARTSLVLSVMGLGLKRLLRLFKPF